MVPRPKVNKMEIKDIDGAGEAAMAEAENSNNEAMENHKSQ